MPSYLKKVLKMLIIILVLLASSVLLFVACAPQLGAVGQSDLLQRSANFRDGKFRNLVPTRLGGSAGDTFKATIDFLRGNPDRTPSYRLPTMVVPATEVGKESDLKVTWLGHSTCLIEIDGRVILTDPMFSDRASPLPFFGPKGFAANPPIQIGELPQIDAVLISHDHYDHLDYASILALKDKTRQFIVPLGVGGHLERWGVAKQQIEELDWWQQTTDGSLTFVATPARHFSGRGLSDGNKTLWASWVIQGAAQNLFFGGDSGYFNGFKKVGEQYGPFDVTMLESGAYHTAWADIHMMPEQTVQAHLDLQGKVLLPIHWGKFNLALHPWTEPIERLLREASKQGALVATPKIGEPLLMSKALPAKKWWLPAPALVAGSGSR